MLFFLLFIFIKYKIMDKCDEYLTVHTRRILVQCCVNFDLLVENDVARHRLVQLLAR